MNKKYKAVLFDMDGVLIDNSEFHYQAFVHFCKKYSLAFSDEIYHNHISGRTNEMILEYFFGKNLTPEKINELALEKEQLYRDLYKDHITPTPGLIEFIHFLVDKNIPIAVASNGPIENINFILQGLKIDSYFKAKTNAYMVPRPKPAPDLFLKAAELLQYKPEDCLVFEDSPTGIKAGNAAGIDVVGLTTTHAENELGNVLFAVKNFKDAKITTLF